MESELSSGNMKDESLLSAGWARGLTVAAARLFGGGTIVPIPAQVPTELQLRVTWATKFAKACWRKLVGESLVTSLQSEMVQSVQPFRSRQPKAKPHIFSKLCPGATAAPPL